MPEPLHPFPGLSPGRRIFLGIALISSSNLMLEVVFTRIFSAMMFYHFTFLAIALALFGVGASGVYVYVASERFPPEQSSLPSILERRYVPVDDEGRELSL